MDKPNQSSSKAARRFLTGVAALFLFLILTPLWWLAFVFGPPAYLTYYTLKK